MSSMVGNVNMGTDKVGQMVPYGVDDPCCALNELSFERLKYAINCNYSLVQEKVGKVFDWVWSSSKTAVADVLDDPKIIAPMKVVAKSLVVGSGTVCLIKAVDELANAVNSHEPKKHLLSASKLLILAGMSFYAGYNLDEK